ncbi:hypothetical protein SCLCIDRAFT_1214677 [Scleroderma citrinum Foug A]|uniref:Uncharacterized protein n=1 Tax=Scleroderma citrinum Foug A TaxID=1036808 RepID=A0A0C3AD71_9AGAM|nr:hypothetical protein SCLCIDRAFT_1214677 [Scleroderma citrinum Foug A]
MSHRPIEAHIFLESLPALSQWSNISSFQTGPPPRHCYPRQAERHHLRLFSEHLDALLHGLRRVDDPVVDDLSYEL